LRSFSNPRHVKAVSLPLEKLKNDLSGIRLKITESLSIVYDQYTVDEWLQTYLIPFENQVCTEKETRYNSSSFNLDFNVMGG